MDHIKAVFLLEMPIQRVLSLMLVAQVEQAGSKKPSKKLKVVRQGSTGGQADPKVRKGKKVKRTVRSELTAGRNNLPSGTGTKKKKIKKAPVYEPYPAAPGLVDSPEVDPDPDDDAVESFMVEPGDVRKPAPETVDPVHADNGKETILEKNGTPAFGESLKVGFRARNSRSRKERSVRSFATTEDEGKDIDSGSDVYETTPDPPVTDVDDESYIEWDSGGGSETAPDNNISSAEEELRELGQDSRGEMVCINCHEPITQRYIKHFTRKQNDLTTTVKGPFCSKMCSLEYR